MQRLALVAVANDDEERERKAQNAQFKLAAVASNFDKAGKIIEFFEEIEREAASGAVVSPKDVSKPTIDDKQFMLSEFRSLGLG